jgi:putative peptide zinc metalloprotease protein
MRFDDERSGLEIGQLQEQLTAIEKQLAEKQEQASRLRIVAPAAGVIIPARPRIFPGEAEDGRLGTWSGSPLAPKNIGAHFNPADPASAAEYRSMICRIGDPTNLEALLVIDQADIDLVDASMAQDRKLDVKLEVDAYPGRTLNGQVEQVARVELKDVPDSLSSQAGGRLETKTDRSGVARPLSTSYHARVPLKDQGKLQGLVCTGMRGRAQIYTQWQSLGSRLYRYLSRTFHFEL